MKEQISRLIQQAVSQLQENGTLPADITPRIQVDNTRDKSHGDFASNIAMMLAKPAGIKPRELAEQITQAFPENPLIEKIDIAGPGFINFFLNNQWLEEALNRAWRDERLGIPEVAEPDHIVVDYSSPNLAKEMHVGHLRSTIIGDAMARLLEFLGHKVTRQNHVGDWGTQFGMLLAYLEETRTTDTATQMALEDLESFYRAAKQRFDESPEFADRARQLVVKLQSGDEQCLALWREFTEISLSHCNEVYQRLGVSLTNEHVRGESAYNDDLPQIVEALREKQLLKEDQGAQCVFLDGFKNQQDEPLPLIVQKADGGYLYATTDLAALRYRAKTLGANRILYVVDQRQALHFQQVFAAARLAGFINEDTRVEHLGFGTMNGEDGKPFKTRSGGTVKLIDLLKEAEQRAYALVKSKNPSLPEEELQTIARTVGIGAVKYADLSKNRISDYIFSFDAMLSFEGNTAPYLLYAYTRVMSLFNKGELDIEQLQAPIVLNETAEQALAEKLYQFNETLQQVAARGTPNTLCTYLYELAGCFSSFYENCPILKADQEAVRQSRARLAWLTAQTLKTGLGILGIDTLNRM